MYEQITTSVSYVIAQNVKNVLVYNTNTPITLTLPDATAYRGREISIARFSDTDLADITLVATVGNVQEPPTNELQSTVVITSFYRNVVYISDGIDWHLISAKSIDFDVDFTLASGKTFTVNNSLTLQGTDGTTLTFQGTDTYVGRATTDALTNKSVNGVTLVSGGSSTLYLSQDGTYSTPSGSGGGGTVTSVNLSVPTGFILSGNPITTSGTIGIAFDTGYSLPTTANQTNWNTAYSNRISTFSVTGNSGAATFTGNTLNIPTYTLAGLGGQPLDADLTAIAALTGSGGFLKTNGSGTWSVDTATYLTGNQNITLSGEVSGSGTTGISVTLSNASVIGKLLTGFTSTTGTITSADSILSAVQKLNGNLASATAGGVSSVTGTLNRITSSGGSTPTIDISSSYVGQTSITTLGVVTTGTYQATAIADSYISSAATWNAKQTAYTNLTSIGTLANSSGVLSNNGSGTFSYIAITGNASHSGDAIGSGALTVVGINGTNLAALGTGILKNTTGTGVPSIAVAGDFPTLNQNTTGSAATLTTSRTIAITGDLSYTSPSFNGSGNVTAVGTLATVNLNVGSFGSATQIATPTVNGKGLITAISNVTIAIPSTQITDFAEALDDRVAALIQNGTGITWSYNDVANTLTPTVTVTGYTTEEAQDAVGAMIDSSLVYVDAAPLLSRAALTGAITATQGSNTTSLGSFTLSQLNTAISDADVATGGGTATNTNTGDNAVNTLYSGLVTNATHTGDATGSTVLTVVGINNTVLSGLATGILKNTTATGIPSIAIAADFPVLNQNTTGTAASVTAATQNSITSIPNLTTVGTITSGSTGTGFTLSLTNSTVSGILLGVNGGTGVANTGKTITLGGNFTTSGAFTTTLTATANTSIILPTTGTLSTLTGSEALTNKSVNGVTLVSGGTATLYLSQDGTYTTPSSGGGSPAGSTTQLQYNNAGAFGGITGATTDGTVVTLTAPILGTPASVTLTNATGLPITTGVSGMGTGVAAFLATPSSANLITAVTDETGTGSLVFATSPTLITPNLGTPSAIVLTNATGIPAAQLSGTIPTGVLGASTLNIGTTSIALNRASGSQALTGITSIDGFAAAVTLTADNTTNAINYPLFVNAATGNLSPRTDTNFTYNPSTGVLTTTTFVGALTGNASTATSAATLTTPRAINGVNFDGSAAITVTAAAGTLTGGTLAAGVTASSLTSVGTITSGTWSGSFGAVSGANLTGLTAGNLSGTIPSAVLGNSAHFIGTTSIALNRASANQALTGILSTTFAGSTSGTTVLIPTAIAGTTTITLPAVTGTVVTTGDSATVTNTMLAGSIANAKLSNSTISGIALGANLSTLTIGTGLTGTSYNGGTATTIAIDSTVATLTGTQTLTNKRINPRVQAVTSSATVTLNADTDDFVTITAQAAGLTVAAPSGTPVQGQAAIYRIKDNGTARSITFNAIFRAIGVTLPTTTTLSKTLYVSTIYNSTDTKWDVLGIALEA